MQGCSICQLAVVVTNATDHVQQAASENFFILLLSTVSAKVHIAALLGHAVNSARSLLKATEHICTKSLQLSIQMTKSMFLGKSGLQQVGKFHRNVIRQSV